jgi:PAS domain S-box-containing protein
MKFFRFNSYSVAKQFLITSLGSIVIILTIITAYMINTSIDSKNAQFEVMTVGRSSGVIEKIDRNFYERFGDVQAFAVNKLAVESAETKASTEDLQKFINTMVSYYVLYDLMLLCDKEGKVLATNSLDKNGNLVKTDFLIGKDFSNEEWFRTCISGKGPEGGAWYSDFIKNDDVGKVYSRDGYGMAFAAPVRNERGEAIGVWYNFANWEDVTTGIRKETEEIIKKSNPGSLIIVTNSKNQIIDCDDPSLILAAQISVDEFHSGAKFQYKGKEISSDKFVVGGKQGTGAYIYKGKNWHALTFIPKTKFSLSYLTQNLLVLLIGMPLILILAGVLLFRLANLTSKNIEELKAKIDVLATGELLEIKESTLQNELGAMTNSLKALVVGMRNTAGFAKQIGKGELSVEYKALGEKDEIGNSLITMRQSLAQIKEADQQREWATNGNAKIGDILRANFSQVTDLYDEVLKFIVKYSNSNQGGIFLVNEGEARELALVASYAYDRKKFIEKSVLIGESLLSQCFLERETIFMTQVPKDYVTITSGLGDAAPSCLIIIPLKVNETIVGVMELASLKKYEQHERALLEKFAESIASTIATVRINERTRLLLEQSQQQTEEMRSQEEEMRQNMEELTATQEEMQRKESEMKGHLDAINNSQASIEFEVDGTIVHANDIFLSTMKYSLAEIKGKHHKLFVDSDHSNTNEYKEFWSSFIEGKSKSGEFLRKAKGGDSIWLMANYTPVMNAQGKVVKVIKLASDITKEKQFRSTAREKIKKLEKEISDWKMKWDELSETFSKNT